MDGGCEDGRWDENGKRNNEGHEHPILPLSEQSWEVWLASSRLGKLAKGQWVVMRED